ncbi:MAG TPA: protease complex subunit PrcB family protein [Flavobacteriaceae bacterium]|nr:protease complex subunit PrcB family protein [Flavobacteriaceae bacterium]
MKNIVFLCITVLLSSCNNGKTGSNDHNLMLISMGSLHGAGKEGIPAQRTVIASKAEWEALKAKMNSVNSVSADFKNDTIDFSEEVVIAIFEPVKTTGGHSVSVYETLETNEEFRIRVKTTAPEGMATSVVTQPYYLAKMKNPSKPIIFE